MFKAAIWANKNKEDAGYTLWASPEPGYGIPSSLKEGLEVLANYEKENQMRPGEGTWLCPLYDWDLGECIVGRLSQGKVTWVTLIKERVQHSLTLTSKVLMDNSPRMIEEVIDLVVADTISTLVETEDTYSHLLDLFIQSGEDIVYNYQQATEHLEFFVEYRELHPLVTKVIENIGVDLWNKMWNEDEQATLSEVLRCFGHGVSFWDKYSPECLDLTEVPKLKTTLEQPWDIATQILDKINEAYPEYQPKEDEEENTDFDQWLATNYSPAGEDASNGEQWFLSNSPHEFMPVSLSTLQHQYDLDNLVKYKEFHLVVTSNNTGETIYYRNLTGENILDIKEYLPEIQEATGHTLDNQWLFPGCGQIGITIGFSKTPENDTCVWDTEDYSLIHFID